MIEDLSGLTELGKFLNFIVTKSDKLSFLLFKSSEVSLGHSWLALAHSKIASSDF